MLVGAERARIQLGAQGFRRLTPDLHPALNFFLETSRTHSPRLKKYAQADGRESESLPPARGGRAPTRPNASSNAEYSSVVGEGEGGAPHETR